MAKVVLTAVLSVFIISNAQSQEIRFDPENSGILITDDNSLQRFLGSVGVRVRPVGNSGINVATIYDSTVTGGEDPDLERGAGWVDGNAGDIDAGGLLILQEYVTPSELVQGRLSSPRGQSVLNGATPEGGNDNGSNDDPADNAPDDGGSGGSILLEYSEALSEFQILLADIQFPGDPANNTGARLTFRNVNLNDPNDFNDDVILDEEVFFINGTTLQGFSNEDRSLNITPVITAASLGMPSFNVVDVNFGSNSGGIGYILTRLADPEVNQSIGSTVFNDVNSNGIQDPGEPGIPGVTVQLIDPNNIASAIITTTVTDSQGCYIFGGLISGDYRVRIPNSEFATGGPLAGFTSIPGGSTSDDNIDGNDDGTPFPGGGNGVQSAVINLSENDEPISSQESASCGERDDSFLGGDNNGNMTIDFGFRNAALASVGDLIFLDTNGNNQQDAGDEGVGGALIQLVDGSGAQIGDFATVSDADGNFSIGSIPPGNYRLKVTAPSGSSLILVTQGVGGAALDSSYNGAGTNMGFTSQFTLAAGQNNPTLDAGFRFPPGQEPVFDFGDAPNTYLTSQEVEGARHIVVAGKRLGASIDDEENAVPSVNADSDGADENGVSFPGGTSIELTDTSFTATVTGVSPTGANIAASEFWGSSNFNGGTGWVGNWTEQNDTNSSTTGSIVVGSAGAVPSSPVVQIPTTPQGQAGQFSITRTFNAGGASGNATFSFRYARIDVETGERLIFEVSPAPGQPFQFITQTPDGSSTGSDDSLTNFPTLSGTIPQNLLTSQTRVRLRATNNTSATNNDFFLVDAIQITAPAAQPRLVGWVDFDRSGTFDAFEAQIVTGSAVNGTNTLTWNNINTLTNSAGPTYARFRLSCDPNLTINTPGGTLNDGEVEDYRLNIGATGAIGNLIFEDRNNNGQVDPGEPGIQGIQVTATNQADNNTFTATTSSSGIYNISNIPAGNYKVSFTPPAAFPASSTVTDTADNGQNNDDNGIQSISGGMVMSPIIAIASGETDNTIDFGLFAPAPLGNLVFNDVNKDGILNNGESGIAGASVQLQNGSGANIGSPIVTGQNGAYLFQNLNPGVYRVKVTAPTNFLVSVPSSGNNRNNINGAETVMGNTSNVTLTSGQQNLTLDAAVYNPASLGNLTFLDSNGDGVFNTADGDQPLGNVQVQLQTSAGVDIGSPVITPTNGIYNFGNLAPGAYQVKFTAPSGFLVTTQGTIGSNNNSNPNGTGTNMGVTATINLSAGQTNSTVDAGFYSPAALGNFLFNDLNGDGLQTTGEPGIEGAIAQLQNSSGANIGSPITVGSNGIYNFTNLLPGMYRVAVTFPDDFLITAQNVGGNDGIDSDVNGVGTRTGVTGFRTLVSGQTDDTNDAGAQETGSIGNFAFIDENGDGIFNANDGDTPLPGVTVQLFQGANQFRGDVTTGANGGYLFDDIPAGIYIVKFTAPTGFLVTVNGSDTTTNTSTINGTGTTMGVTVPIVLDPGEFYFAADAGFFQPSSLGDLVFNDSDLDGSSDGESGVENATVELILNGSTLATDTTDSAGAYLFENLAPGDYMVKVTAPTGFLVTQQNVGSDATDSDIDGENTNMGTTAAITITSGDNDLTNDAGLFQTTGIGNFAFEDMNGDGVFNGNDVPLAGVTVQLLDADGVDVPNVADQVTPANGSYNFGNLPADDYIVKFTAPTGFLVSVAGTAGVNNTNQIDGLRTTMGQTPAITLTAGNPVTTADAAFYRPASLGDLVFEDLNNDGIRNGGGTENGFENALVELFKDGVATGDSVTTPGTGRYTFSNLLPGNYSVKVTIPTGHLITIQNAGTNENRDSDVDGENTNMGTTGTIVLESGDQDPTNDAGVYAVSSLGNLAFTDVDGDGIFTSGTDTPLAGVVVVLRDENGDTVDSVTTGPDGLYAFNNLPTGDYTVKVTAPTGLLVTIPGAANTDNANSFDGEGTNMGVTPTVTLTPGTSNQTLDAGFYAPAELGNLVFNDLDNDGQFEDASEDGIAGAIVELLKDGTLTGDSVTTTSTGLYLFDDLLPGTYSVKVTAPTNYVITQQNVGSDLTDSDVGGVGTTMGTTANILIVSGESDLTNDAGVFRGATVGNFVFVDLDGDGVRDSNENGLPGVIVNLIDAGGNTVGTVNTDPNGEYSFTDVPAGSYTVKFTQPANSDFVVSAAGTVGTNNTNQLDDEGATMGTTASFVLEEGDDIQTIDAAFYEPASLGDLVFQDTDRDGQRESGEPPVTGAIVMLLEDGVATGDSVTTTSTGLYSFDNLAPGNYSVKVTAPTGFLVTVQNIGADVSDSDISGTDTNEGTTATVTLISGENDDTLDAGLYPTASVGNQIFVDANGNGVNDGEAPLQDAVVSLLDSNGDVVGSPVTTGSNGQYLFTNLPVGTYTVKVVAPSGSAFIVTVPGTPATDNQNSIDGEGTNMGETSSFTLVANQTDLTQDAGFYEPATLGNFIFNDVNNDGQFQSATETGIAGALVELFKDGAATGDTVTTLSNGAYLFEDLLPGNYTVRVTAPTGFVITEQNIGNDETDSDVDGTDGSIGNTAVVVLESGDVDLTVDAGVYQPTNLGNLVFIDNNADGVFNSADGDLPLEGAIVQLFDADGDQVGSDVVTPADGMYSFDNLGSGNYTVKVTAPVGSDFVVTEQGAAGVDNNSQINGTGTSMGVTATIALVSGVGNTTVDAGFYELSSIGNLVFNDVNKDGVLNNGESGIGGATVTLFDAAGDQVGSSIQTPASGAYLFENLVPGDYTVQVEAPTDFLVSTQGSGNNQSNIDGTDTAQGTTATIALGSGVADLDNDAGVYQPASLGNLVFIDVNGNGERDSTEPGLENAVVTLFDSNGDQVGLPILTDGAGEYNFPNLAPDDYTVVIGAPAGTDFLVTIPGTIGTDSTNQLNNQGGNSGTTAPITVEPGDDIVIADGGFYEPASLGDFVFNDLGNDGQQADDNGVAGATVTLIGSDGNTVGTPQVTIGNGAYLFSDLLPGNYRVRVDAPVGFVVTAQNVGSDITDSDINGTNTTTGVTALINLSSNEDERAVDAGLYQPASIGNLVFEDTNGDGILNNGESGLSGVEVTLTDEDNNQTVVTTGPDGSYVFENLAPGTYSVKFKGNGNFVVSAPGTTGTNNTNQLGDEGQMMAETSVTITAGQNAEFVDAAFYEPASIGDFVFNDEDRDGQSTGDSGVADAVVMLLDADNGDAMVGNAVTTGSDGAYAFTELAPGNYKVKVTAPTGSLITTQNVGADATDSDVNGTDTSQGVTAAITLESGDVNNTVDAGVYPTSGIGNLVFTDVDGDGIFTSGVDTPLQGAVVTLLDGDGDPLSGVAQITTGVDGIYNFDGLPAGTYIVKVTAPANTANIVAPAGPANTDNANSIDGQDASMGQTVIITLNAGDSDQTQDAGFYIPARLGDLVFNDLNNDGQLNGTESGIAGARVELLKDGAATGDEVTTDSSGFYEFTGLLPADDYAVRVTAPTNYVITLQNAGNDTTDSDVGDVGSTVGTTAVITLVSGQNDPTNDAGVFQGATLGNLVFVDTNGDGILNNGESGLAGVTVTLFDSNGDVFATTPTDSNGAYLFSDLPPDDYTVQFTGPGDFVVSAPGTVGVDETNQLDNEGQASGTTAEITVTEGADIITADAAFYEPATLGNLVFLDEDNNGQLDGDDEGIAGATVMLLDADDSDAMVGAAQVTLSNGLYLFENLAPGNYKVKVTAPAGTLTTLSNVGSDITDSDVIGNNLPEATTAIINLESGENDLTNDAGVYETGSIGNQIFVDLDGDGEQDSNEPGLSGATVQLLDSDGDVIDTIVTGATGSYTFSGLAADDYTIKVIAPSGTDFLVTRPGTGAEENQNAINGEGTTMGQTQVISLGAAEDNTDQDAGFYEPASLGDLVFFDANNNGVFEDATENGIANATVMLLNADNSDAMVGSAQVTGNDGLYLFENLAPGNYRVKVTAPSGTVITTQNVGSDVTDSDVNGENTIEGTTDPIALTSNEDERDVDAGVYQTAALGDLVFIDVNADGIFTLGTDTPLSGATVMLLDAGGDMITGSTNQVTGPNGRYSFAGLPAGSYRVKVTAPSDFEVTDLGSSSTQEVSVIDGQGTNEGMSPVVTLTAGQVDNSLDAGFFERASLGNFIFNDTNNDGQQAGDSGVEGVSVTLLDDTGNPAFGTTTQTTTADGEYLFSDLKPGNYTVRLTNLPTGFIATTQNTGNDTTDSDLDPSTLTITPDLLESGEDDLTNDAGIFLGAELGNFVFFDDNNDGLLSSGEAGISGLTVELLDENGDVEDTTTTDINGEYLFTGLTPGDYSVRVIPSSVAQLASSSAPEGNNANNGTQSASGEPSESAVITLAADESNQTVDFGFVPTFGIGNVVFREITGQENGRFDINDVAIPGITLSLFSASDVGTVIDTVVTDSNGCYLFSGLPAGEYFIRVDKEAFAAGADLEGHNATIRGVAGAIDDDENHDARVTPFPERLGVYSEKITLSSGLIPTAATGETGKNANTDNAFDRNFDLTIDFGFRVFEVASQGCFFVKQTGEIIRGGRIEVTQTSSPTGVIDPANILIADDGSQTGCYSWFAINTEGTFCQEFIPPAGYTTDPASPVADFDPNDGNPQTPFDPSPSGVTSSTPQFVSIGAIDADGDGFLDDGSSTANPYYLKQTLESGDPLVLGNNHPLCKASDFAEWLLSQGPDFPTTSSVPSEIALEDGDADGFSNLIEFAFCFKGTSGVKSFPDGSTGNNGLTIRESAADSDVLEACFFRPPGATELTYTFQTSSDGQTWTDVTTSVTVVQSVDETVGNGSEKVILNNLEGITGLAERGLIRVKVDATIGGNSIADVSDVSGWQSHLVKSFCETYSNPFMLPCLFTGSVDAGYTGGLELPLSVSIGDGDLLGVIDSDKSYYIEVISGTLEGHTFDVAEVSETSVTIAVDDDLYSGAPHNSLLTNTPEALAALAGLEGDIIVLREHRTVADLFPRQAYTPGITPEGSARLLLIDRATSRTDTLFLADAGGGNSFWVATGAGGGIVDDVVIPPCQGVFTHNLAGEPEFNDQQFGEVRTNKLHCPLKEGPNLIASIYPLDQTPLSRGMLDPSIGFTSSRSASRADQILNWTADDLESGETAEVFSYGKTFLNSRSTGNRWLQINGRVRLDLTESDLFRSDRAAIYQIFDADGIFGNDSDNLPNYFIPSPISNSID